MARRRKFDPPGGFAGPEDVGPKAAKRKPAPKPAPPRRSGATSGDLTVEGYDTKTPIDRGGSKKTKKRKKARKKATRVKVPKGPQGPVTTPQTALKAAKEGKYPPASLKKSDPKAYKAARQTAKLSVRSGEGLKEDAAAELVLSSLATAGLGTGAKLAAKGVEAAGAKALAGSAAKTGEKAIARATKAAKTAGKRRVARVKSAPSRAAKRVKETPKRIKTAPRRAKTAASTKEGRRAVAKSTGKKVYSHPISSAAGGSYAANKAGVDAPGVDQLGALVEGHVEALKDNPAKTLKTTARAIPGIVTGPAALLGSAGTSAIHGTPKPLEEEASKQFKGLKDVGEKLLSGDPEKVQKTVEDEVGLSFVAPLPAISRVRGTKLYRETRGKARAKVAAKREGTRVKKREQLREYKKGQRKREPTIRHAVKDTATGEERILRRTGKALEGRRQRKAVSTTAARHKAQGEREALLASKDVVKDIRRSKLSGGRKGRADAGDALATVVQYGISRRKQDALRQIKDIEAGIGKLDPDEIPTNTITDIANLRFLRENADVVFTDKNFWKAVDAYKKQAKQIETSGRKKVLAIGDTYGLKRPEELLEEGVQVRGKTIRSRYIDPDRLARKQAKLREMRQDAKVAAEGLARARTKDEKARYGAVASEIAAQAKVLERELKDNRLGRKQAEKDYARSAQEVIRREGLEQPAYVKDVKTRSFPGAEPTFPGGRSARKQHMAKGVARERGGAERNFETLANQSIAEPRMRRAMHRATTEFVERFKVPVGNRHYLTSREIERAINRGELDPTQYVPFHSQFFKQAILDPHKSGEAFTSALRETLDTSMLAQIKNRADDPGNKYVLLPKEAVREFVHQMEPPKGMDKLFGGANRLLSRVILGYSPSWAVAQLVAEGLPAAITVGANPFRLARVAKFLAREDKKLSTKDRAAIDGMVGESAGVTPHPQIQFRPDTNLMASRFLRLSKRNPVGRALLKGATGEALGVFDRWKGGKLRKAVAAAKADRELNGFVNSLSALMRGQRSIIEAVKGKPLKEQMAYIANHPAQAAKLEGYLDNVMGNWRALTRHEAKIAPLVVFYPFVRYSLRWTFWAFPKEHPVKASILYFLSQQNAEELEKLAGGPLASPLEYTFPVYTGSKGTDAVLPGGSRIAPGMNAISTAVGKGKIENLGTALNPALSIALMSGVAGIDPFTGEKVANSPLEHGLLALNALLSLPAPARLLNLNEVGDEQSVLGKTFEGTDPNREARSFAMPFLPQSGEKFGESQRLSKDVAKKYSDPIPELFDNPAIGEAIFGGDGKTVDWKAVNKLVREHRQAEKAGDRVTSRERPFFDSESADGLTDEQMKALKKLQDGRILVKPAKPKPNPFGIPSTDASDLREQFGIPETSAAELRKQFGID